jgi:beta-phosphoglucomutase-like phosphatase (HAD superfamily)
MRRTPAFVSDLDGTLVDSVYQHVLAWHAGASRYPSHVSLPPGRLRAERPA